MRWTTVRDVVLNLVSAISLVLMSMWRACAVALEKMQQRWEQAIIEREHTLPSDFEADLPSPAPSPSPSPSPAPFYALVPARVPDFSLFTPVDSESKLAPGRVAGKALESRDVRASGLTGPVSARDRSDSAEGWGRSMPDKAPVLRWQ